MSWIIYILGWEASLLIGQITIFTRMGSVLVERDGYYFVLGWEVSLLIGMYTSFIMLSRPYTTLTTMGSFYANRAGQYIY